MGKKYALIIGSNIFTDHALSKLEAPPTDVGSLAKLLRDQDVGGFDEITTLINEPWAITHTVIADFFAEKQPDDVLLLYFSGHGVLDERGRLFLAMTDTRRNRLSGSAVSSHFVVDEMDNSRSKRQVLILDCCYSGAFARGTKASVGSEAVTQATFEGNGRGRVILTASGATQYAWEGDEIVGFSENSLFTHFLLEGLNSGAADLNSDGQISIDEWYAYAYEQIEKIETTQRPQMWAYRLEGNIVIAQARNRSTPNSLDYRHEHFVNRNDEISQVMKTINQIAAEPNPSRDIILNFYGTRGVGKSWLLQEVRWQLKYGEHKSAGAEVLYVARVQLGLNSTDIAVADIAIQALELLGVDCRSSVKSPEQLNMDLREQLIAFAPNPFVFLFDQADSVNQALFEGFVHDIPGLHTLPNVLFIVATLHRLEVREFFLRVHTRMIPLPPFDIHTTQLQLERQIPAASAIADYIQRLSNGNPWTNYLYAQSVIYTHKSYDVTDTYLSHSPISKEVLEALCVLRVYNIASIVVMLKAYFGDKLETAHATDPFTVVRELTKARVISWETSKRAYVMSEPLRSEIEAKLKTKDRSLWRHLHLEAYKLYCRWAQEVPERRAFYRREATIHSFILEIEGAQPEDCFEEPQES